MTVSTGLKDRLIEQAAAGHCEDAMTPLQHVQSARAHENSEFAIVRRPPLLVLIPMQDASHVILSWHYRAPIGRVGWELPTIRLRPDDSLDDGVARSCMEHFGLMPGCVQHLCALHLRPDFSDEETIFCRVTDLAWPGNGAAPRPEHGTCRRSRAVTIAEAKDMVRRGAIVDVKTVCGVLLI